MCQKIFANSANPDQAAVLAVIGGLMAQCWPADLAISGLILVRGGNLFDHKQGSIALSQFHYHTSVLM